MNWLNRAGTRLSHADLLEILLNQPDKFERIARNIGFERVAEPSTDGQADAERTAQHRGKSNITDVNPDASRPQTPSLTAADRPKMPFYYVAHRERSEQHLNPEPPELPQWFVEAVPLEDDPVFDPAAVSPTWRPLTRKPRLWGQLRQHLKQLEQTELPDIPRILDQLGRGDSLRQIPLQRKARRIRHVRVIFDDAQHLRTARRDVQQLYLDLVDYWGAARVSWQRIQDEPLSDLTQRKLAADTALIVLSDCGVTLGDSAQWEVLFRRVRQCGVICLVLGLAARKDLQAVCTQGVRAFSWDQGLLRVSGVDNTLENDVAESDKVADAVLVDDVPACPELEKLFSYLAFSYRIEPGLLREVRINLRLDSCVEAQCRLHDAVDDDGWFLYLKDEVLATYRRLFGALPEAEQRRAVRWVMAHHAVLPASVLDYELVVAQEYCDWDVPSFVAAQDRLRRLAKTFQGQADSHLLGCWVDGYLRTQAGNEVDLAAAFFVTRHKEQLARGEWQDLVLPRGVSPQDLARFMTLTEPSQSLQIRQVGQQLQLQPIDSTLGFPVLDSELSHRVGRLNDRPVSVTSGAVLTSEASGFELDTGTEHLVIRTTTQPDWASNIGRDHTGLFVECELYGESQKIYYPRWGGELERDECGVFTDLSIRGVVQRMRYIPPGVFMMGSPADEPERDNDGEDYHQVTLTQGYWLADTACTQALWELVMGENQADFNDNPENPVETVSRLDVQVFFKRFGEFVPGASAQLPSDAQWEYACRAGTTTPFSFGENITPDQVNYDGNYPYAGGDKGECRERTVPVKSLPVNPWGLYEMHGNVWEWCQDAFIESLGTGSVVDPFRDEGESNHASKKVLRVLRGGSWDGIGGLCRSAVRNYDRAGSLLRSDGFRFALGHELQPSPASRSEKAEELSEWTEHESARRGAAQRHDQAESGPIAKVWGRVKKLFGGEDEAS